MKRYSTIIVVIIMLASCSTKKIKQHAAAPPDEGCGQCHYLIYNNWKLSYKPYEKVPVLDGESGSGRMVDYHDRRFKEEGEGAAVTPVPKDCSRCHAISEKPEGTCTRDKAGFR